VLRWAARGDLATRPGLESALQSVAAPEPAGSITALTDAGYLEQDRRGGRDLWSVTVQGMALAKARLGRPMTRAKAQANVDALLGRVREVNADNDCLYWIELVSLFGSFAIPAIAMVGDVDLHVITRHRQDGDEHVRRIKEIANESGRSFSSYFERLTFAQMEFYRRVRGRNQRLDIQFDDVEHMLDLPPGATRVEIYRRVG
jgi:hypothetical protein